VNDGFWVLICFGCILLGGYAGWEISHFRLSRTIHGLSQAYGSSRTELYEANKKLEQLRETVATVSTGSYSQPRGAHHADTSQIPVVSGEQEALPLQPLPPGRREQSETGTVPVHPATAEIPQPIATGELIRNIQTPPRPAPKRDERGRFRPPTGQLPAQAASPARRLEDRVPDAPATPPIQGGRRRSDARMTRAEARRLREGDPETE
jgi:hypothetical protein